MIADGSQVQVHYTLTVDDAVVDSSVEDEPLSYKQGEGEILPALEAQLIGLAVGDKKDVVLSPEEAYGERSDEAVQAIPKAAFNDSDELSVGDVVRGETQKGPFQATVAAVEEDTITLDMNHPLAGKTLSFSVEVVGIE